MKKRESFREGVIGALIDEYELAVKQFNDLILSLDKKTYYNKFSDDKEFGAINLIVRHVIESGEIYISYIQKILLKSKENLDIDIEGTLSQEEACPKLLQQVKSYEIIFEEKWRMSDAEIEMYKINTNWGTIYDLEQLLEHAIVHLYRHKRQIEKSIADYFPS